MSPSVHFNNMMTDPDFSVSSDIRPWGGVSPIFTIDASVESINISVGADVETAEIVLNDADFGDELDSYLPVSITDLNTNKVCFRGFVVQNTGALEESGQSQRVTLYGYKWMLSKRTQLRGKWYLVQGAVVAPPSMGSGISAGDAKYTFEKFRSDLETLSGYMQNEQLVFNAGGTPDCFIDNDTSNSRVAFYYDDMEIDEEDGPPNTVFQSKDYNGFYWTWCTIIRHVYNFWIEPYNVVLASVNLDSTDLSDLAAIDASYRAPMDFSLEGMNPMSALDTIVSSIPGKWFWYIEYTALSVKIRFKEMLAVTPPGTMTLTAPVEGEKLVNSDFNISQATVTRNYTKAVANVVGLGGRLKVVSTFKLVPLWVRFDDSGTYRDFASQADFEGWKKWCDWYYSTDKEKQDKSISSLTSEQIARYARIYRYYGIPEEGELLGNSIVSENSGSPDILNLTGDPFLHYDYFEKPAGGSATVRDYFFTSGRFPRELSPPEYKRFSDKIQVFMYDSKYTAAPKTSAGVEIVKKAKASSVASIPTPTQISNQTGRKRWVFPDDEGIGYNIDDKNLTILFDHPQCKIENAFRETEKDKFIESITKETWQTIASRDVYLTGTLSTDLAAVLNSIISGGYVETNGAPFSAYVNARNQDIIYHVNAWYPITSENRDTLTPAYSTATMDSHIVADVVRKADTFDDYREYIGEGHVELARAILNWKMGYSAYEETVSVTMPYFDDSIELGATLTEIENTNYNDLESYLMSINLQRIGDSDSYETRLEFSNTYYTDRGNLDFVPQRHSKNKNSFNARSKYVFVNEYVDGDMPAL